MRLNPEKISLALARLNMKQGSDLNLTDIADMIEMQRSVLTRRGKSSRPSTVARIAKALGVDPLDIVDLDLDPDGT